MLISVTDNIMHIYLNKMVFNLTESKNKPLICANLKSHLGASFAVPLWGYQAQKTELPSPFRISHAPADFCDSLCKEKAILQMTKFSFLTRWADFTLRFEHPPQYQEFLPSQICRWTGPCCRVPGSMHPETMVFSWAGSIADYQDTPGSCHLWAAGQAEKEPAHLIWSLHLTYFVLCPPCYKSRSSLQYDALVKDENTSLKRKRSWPGNAADAKLRLCSCVLIYELWTDFFMLWMEYWQRLSLKHSSA